MSDPEIVAPGSPPAQRPGDGGPPKAAERHSILLYLSFAAVILLWWIAGAAFLQEGWAGCAIVSAWLFGLVMAVVLLIATHESVRHGPLVFLGTLVVPATVLWLYAAGTLAALRDRDWATLAWDVAALASALALSSLATEWLGQRKDRDGRPLQGRLAVQWASVQGLTLLALAWILLSLVSMLRAPALPVDARRFARPTTSAPVADAGADRWNDLRIGLALSGGGYRAAVFHAGVLQALEELGLRVDNLSTVSGGSIVGSYYAVGGDPAAFVRAVARGRFDLKRRLLSIPNALLLALPARVAGSRIELLPFGDFDRLDVQRRLLERALFGGARLSAGLGGGEPRLGQPHLMIAVTDLTYGFQIGLLPDGLVVLGEGGTRDVYRGDAFEAERALPLAERVALSGAFPGAFPGRPWRVRVAPAGATGRGWRGLLLVDGGARDNLGLELLRAADALADDGAAPGLEDNLTPAHWDLDAVLVSDGGAAFGVLEEPGSSLAQLSRTVDVSAIPFHGRGLPGDECASVFEQPPRFSPALQLLPAETLFKLERASTEEPPLPQRWRLRFDPARYPEAVSRRLVALLPDAASRNLASDYLDAFLAAWGTHRSTGRDWSSARRSSAGACSERAAGGRRGRSAEAPILPGACESLALESVLLASIHADLSTFLATPTLADRLPRETARALERLGKTLVYLEWPRLERRLDTAASCRAAPAVVPAGGPFNR